MQSATVYCLRCGARNDPQMPYCVQCGNALAVNQTQPDSTVVQNNSPIAPPPPPLTGYNTFPVATPTVPAYPFDPYTQPALQKKKAINPLLLVSILVALVLIISGIVFAVFRANSPTYPMLASAYAGSVHNNTVNMTGTFTLTNVVEDAQGNISGNVLIGAPLAGSGPFKGSVGTDKSIQFTITPSDNSGVSSIHCTGNVQADGSLIGIYTVSNTAETGTWQAK